MKKLLILVVVAIVSAVFVACQAGTAGLSEQDKAAIRKVVDDAAKIPVAPKADYAAYVALYYAEDATVLASNMPPVQGRAAIQAMLSSFPPMSEFRTDIVDLDGRGDLAYVRGNYTLTVNPPGAPAMTDKGKYVEVWKKGADGMWKVNYDSWSSDLPVPGLTIPTGAVAANASDEVKKLGDVVGRWKIDGTATMDPKAPPQPVALALDCQWFGSGLQVVCAYTGMSAGQPYQEADVYSYDAKAKAYSVYSVVNPGGVMSGKLTMQPDTWVQVWEFPMDGKPARMRLTIANMPAGRGDWKNEMSVAGGPWTVLGEGKFEKAK